MPETPDVPSFAELSRPDLAVDAWFGLWGPARMPAELVTALGAACVHILGQPDLVERLRSQGFVTTPLAPPAFAAFQREEMERWRGLVDLTGIRLEN